jgi:hypothetical protein
MNASNGKNPEPGSVRIRPECEGPAYRRHSAITMVIHAFTATSNAPNS